MTQGHTSGGSGMIVQGDVLEWAARYDGPKFHALLCDPPYGLGFMGVAWDTFKQSGKGKGGERVAGLRWDDVGGNSHPRHPGQQAGILRRQNLRMQDWFTRVFAALGEHMHPGAFGMAFASSRGWHRLACAIEDAGFTIHPSIFVWGFGSGFPKATRIDTQVDKAAGAEREVVRMHNDNGRQCPKHQNTHAHWDAPQEFPITAPATPLAQTWAGHRYGLQAIKPACEPVIVFQKPYQGKPVECIVRTGAGALWVDGGRIGIQDADNLFAKNPHTQNKAAGWVTSGGTGAAYEVPSGRWPANFALIHSPNCNGECAPECAVRRLGEQSGESTNGGIRDSRGRTHEAFSMDTPRKASRSDVWQMPKDTGTAARYLFQAQWDQLDAADPVRYQAKASRRERDAGLDGLPESAGAHKYGSIRSERGNGYDEGSRACNPHPTVKPIALIEHLATLLLPPAEYAPRRIMVPFAGSGSEMIGATMAGWDEVVGIEREAEYVEIAEKRLAYWREKREEKAKEAESQMSLLEVG